MQYWIQRKRIFLNVEEAISKFRKRLLQNLEGNLTHITIIIIHAEKQLDPPLPSDDQSLTSQLGHPIIHDVHRKPMTVATNLHHNI